MQRNEEKECSKFEMTQGKAREEERTGLGFVFRRRRRERHAKKKGQRENFLRCGLNCFEIFLSGYCRGLLNCTLQQKGLLQGAFKMYAATNFFAGNN
jgi:hypothetical protein